MEEFDLDEIAELSGMLKLAELSEKEKELDSSKTEESSTEEPSSKNTKEDLIFIFPDIKEFIEAIPSNKLEDFIGFLDYLDLLYKDSWDLAKTGNKLMINVLIKFDEVEIVNSKNLKHKIKELFLRFSLSSNISLVGTIQGARTKVSLKELSIGRDSVYQRVSSISSSKEIYIHSHLKSYFIHFINLEFNSFCLGQSELSQILGRLENNPSLADWLKFLTLLEPLTRWESLEGVPYRYLSNLPTAISNGSITHYSEPNIRRNQLSSFSDTHRSFLELYLKRYTKVLGYNNGELNISFNRDLLLSDFYEELEKGTSEVANLHSDFWKLSVVIIQRGSKYKITPSFLDNYKQALLTKDGEKDTSEKVVKVYDTSITFKGKKYHPKVVEDNSYQKDDNILATRLEVVTDNALEQIIKILIFNNFLRNNYEFNK